MDAGGTPVLVLGLRSDGVVALAGGPEADKRPFAVYQRDGADPAQTIAHMLRDTRFQPADVVPLPWSG